MGVADLILSQPAAPVLVDQVLAGEPVVDVTAGVSDTSQRSDRHRHRQQGSHWSDRSSAGSCWHKVRRAHADPANVRYTYRADPRPAVTHRPHCATVSDIVTEQVTYGADVPGDDVLGLLGDVSTGRRVIELGIAENSVALALQGAKAIAVDPDPERISALRLAANTAEVWVECHEGDLGDLGFAPSGTIDLVLSVHTLDLVDDLGRILRQVHRVLKPGAPFVLVLDHPFASVGPDATGRVRRYGEERRTVAELLAALDRSNFRVEVFHELGVGGESSVPTTLALKVRKQGS